MMNWFEKVRVIALARRHRAPEIASCLRDFVVHTLSKKMARQQKSVDCKIVQLYICFLKGGKSAMAKKKKATTKKAAKKTTKKKK